MVPMFAVAMAAFATARRARESAAPCAEASGGRCERAGRCEAPSRFMLAGEILFVSNKSLYRQETCRASTVKPKSTV